MLKRLLERLGAVRPPSAPSAPPGAGRRPGVTVHAATEAARLGAGEGRPAESRVEPAGERPDGAAAAWAAVLLAGDGRGDVVFLPRAPAPPEGAPLLLDGARGDETGAPDRIARDALSGAAVTGVTGARLLARTELRAVLRLGPPPAARWEVVGLRSVAVFAGKLTLVDGEEPRDVFAGQVAFVADPEAPLPVLAGNDAAVAVAFTAPDVAVRLR